MKRSNVPLLTDGRTLMRTTIDCINVGAAFQPRTEAHQRCAREEDFPRQAFI